MKHPSTREFFAYWDEKRGHARAPNRSDIDPTAVRELLGDIFVLSYGPTGGFPFRVAGTRVCALLGRDLKDTCFSALFAEESRAEIVEIATVVAEETLGAVVGLTARREDNSQAQLELLLLPFNSRPHTPVSITGVLAPFDREHGRLDAFKPTSWRYLYPSERFFPRVVRKLKVARGFMVYEGLR